MDQQNLLFLAFGVLIGLGFLFRRWYLRQPKSYQVSGQFSGEYFLSVTDLNPRTDEASLKLHLTAQHTFESLPYLAVELIKKTGEFDRITFQELGIQDSFAPLFGKEKELEITFEKRDLLHPIRDRELKLGRFRLTVLDNNKVLIKTPVFMLSQKFMLIPVERGKFN
jgi:hypothetical protein